MSKVKKGEVVEARFTILDEQGNKVKRRRSFRPVLAVGMIAGTLFLYACAAKIGREADQMPATEQEVLLQMQYEQATQPKVHKSAQKVVPRKVAIARQLTKLASAMKTK